MLGTLNRMMALGNQVSVDPFVGLVLAMILVLLTNGAFFQFDGPMLKLSTLGEVVRYNFAWQVVLVRLALLPVYWASLNYLARSGGLWFSMLVLTLLGRVIQILTFGFRFGQWPDSRDWAAIALMTVAVIVAVRMPK